MSLSSVHVNFPKKFIPRESFMNDLTAEQGYDHGSYLSTAQSLATRHTLTENNKLMKLVPSVFVQ